MYSEFNETCIFSLLLKLLYLEIGEKHKIIGRQVTIFLCL